MTVWRIWSVAGYGAFEFLGEADGETFREACVKLAEINPAFQADFDPDRMTLQGCPLVPLDRRIDGKNVQFGDVRDVIAN